MREPETEAVDVHRAWTRAAAYLGVAVVTSAGVGVIATSLSDTWATMSPFSAGFLALMWFGPMSVVLGFAPVSRAVSLLIALLLAAAVSASWIAFASNDSSTSALVFLWAWIAGVPLAAAVVAVYRKAGPRTHRDARQ